MQNTAATTLESADRVFIDKVVTERAGRPGALLSILEAVQEHEPHKYLPLAALRYVAAATDLPLARVYSVATFYSLFNLEPQGDHTISICRGTACHTRGSRTLLQSAKHELGIRADEPSEEETAVLTTADAKFTVRTVACFGQCALAPVIEIDHRICSHVTERTLQREIRAIDREMV